MNICQKSGCVKYTREYVNNCNTYKEVTDCVYNPVVRTGNINPHIKEYTISNVKTVDIANKVDEKAVEIAKENMKALDVQVGGGHYKKYGDLQPIEVAMKFKYNALQYKIFKYITRYKDKNGIEDLHKIKHCVDLLIDIEYKK